MFVLIDDNGCLSAFDEKIIFFLLFTFDRSVESAVDVVVVVSVVAGVVAVVTIS